MPPGQEEEEEEKREVVDCMLRRLWATVCQQKEALALAQTCYVVQHAAAASGRACPLGLLCEKEDKLRAHT